VNPCPAVQCTNTVCPFGTKVTSAGCPTCECINCTKPVCSTDVVCLTGYKFDANRCPTCDCNPPCINYCQFGYADSYFTATASTTNADTCKCNCDTSKVCTENCVDGYVVDAYGCKTCECIRKYPTCPKIACDIYCKYGHVLENGCPVCKCNDPPVCIEQVCSGNCIYGIVEENGCKTCKCEPCPQVKCALECKYGFARDLKTGCPTCDCNPAPICTGATSSDIANICNLKCDNTGIYYDKEGCPHCTCNEVKPCECGPFPTDQVPVLCEDKVTEIKLLNECIRTADNLCYYKKTSCPYGFTVIIKAGSTFTETDKAKILTQLGVTANDVTFTKTVDTTSGDIKIIIWVKKDSLPEGKTAGDVNNEIDATVKLSSPTSQSMILSDGSVVEAKSFAINLVPLFGLFLAVLFF
jgi:hypothetical protein